MNRSTSPWVIVLAAGAGTRLAELTVGRDGVYVPKQFCSLRGGRSLLVAAIGRARNLTIRERIVVVVAAEHERWWREQLGCVDAANVVVQPANRGTAAGLLLPLLHVLARDPAADVVVVPSDHHVERPAVLTAALQRAAASLRREPDRAVLLGIAPDSPDTEYGWIVPGAGPGGLRTVAAFVEKPDFACAATLLQAGGVWNSFLFAVRGRRLLELCEQHVPEVAAPLRAVFARPAAERAEAVAHVYRSLPTADFSRAVLQCAAADLRLLPVPECGWTDLGTPLRVADCIARLEMSPEGRLPPRAPWFDSVDLAAVLAARLGGVARTA